MTWPLFAAALPVTVALPVWWSAPAWLLVVVGIMGGIPQAVSTIWRGPRWWRIVAKAVGGVALASLAAGILWWPAPVVWKALAASSLALGFAAMLFLRMRSILRVCDACPWARDWGRCPGFTGRNG